MNYTGHRSTGEKTTERIENTNIDSRNGQDPRCRASGNNQSKVSSALELQSRTQKTVLSALFLEVLERNVGSYHCREWPMASTKVLQ